MATQITYPDPSFTDRLKMDLGGVNVEVLYIARSHTDDSLLVYLPEEKVLFAGDALFADCYPFMLDGFIPGWIKTIDYISTLNVDKIIPGHGPIPGKKDVADMKAYLLAFDKKERRLCAKSNDIEYRAAEIKKSVPRRAQADFLIMGSIQAKYLKKR
jgi:glyoxylase-like metal-dependent hydrolase (beta-lactamase superfamily II)